MTSETMTLATARGVQVKEASGHSSQPLTQRHLLESDIVLAMAKDHRRQIVELVPGVVRTTFTIREFARLSRGVPLAQLGLTGSAEVEAVSSEHVRLDRVLSFLSARRGVACVPTDPADDDIIDPYRRSFATYSRSARDIDDAIAEVERVLRGVLRAS